MSSTFKPRRKHSPVSVRVEQHLGEQGVGVRRWHLLGGDGEDAAESDEEGRGLDHDYKES
jgi:hypothetical protein